MKTGITIETYHNANFSCQPEFTVPVGTPVYWGYPSADGSEFPHWVISREDASRLSGNDHDATYRFCIIPHEFVKKT